LILVGFLAVDVLLLVPAYAAELRLDLIHPSLPIIDLKPVASANSELANGLQQALEGPALAIASQLGQGDRLGLTVSGAAREAEDEDLMSNAVAAHSQGPLISAENDGLSSTSTPEHTYGPGELQTPAQTSPTPVGASQSSPTPMGMPGSTATKTPTPTPTATKSERSTSPPTAVSLGTPTPIPPPPTQAPTAGLYFVAPDGDDSNAGTIDRPWRTLSAVHAGDFLPGDVVHFMRGGSWSGGLVINDSGVEGRPITFTAYGEGDRPIFTNPGGAGSFTRAIEIYADWVMVEDLLVQDSHEAGIYIATGSDHNVIQGIEATDVGIGVAILGQHNLVTRSHVYDLHMVVNTQGGSDDFGAVGIWFFNSNNEASYNKIEDCNAKSYDFGHDGGVFEFFGNADNNLIHHNWGEASAMVFEVGGGSAKNNVVAYNVFVNNSGIGGFHLKGAQASEVQYFRFENNVVVEMGNTEIEYSLIWWNGDPSPDTFVMRNNILYARSFQYVTQKAGFTHDHNVYYFLDDATELSHYGDYYLGIGELIDDPLFLDVQGSDFHLRPNSPAIDAGVELGYPLDFDDNAIPRGSSPDIGACEY
jgi:hypothetical protein